MKIYAIDRKTKKPLVNYDFQIQIQGNETEYVSVTTDFYGHFDIDEQYEGAELTVSLEGHEIGKITAYEGAQLVVDAGVMEKHQ